MSPEGFGSPDATGSTLVSPPPEVDSPPPLLVELEPPEEPGLDDVPVDVGATDVGPTEPEGPTPALPLGPTLVPPLGPDVPLGPTCDPDVPVEVGAGFVEVLLVVEVPLEEEVLLALVAGATLPLGDVDPQLAPVHVSLSPAHAATRKLPAAETKKPKRAEERDVRNVAGVDITNSR